MMTPAIRLATRDDLGEINDIYNYYVTRSTCTYQEEPSTAAEREAWFESHGPKHPITVAHENGRLLGWASLSEFRTRAAYRFTVENTVYIHHDLHRRGIGSILLADSIERARAIGHHSIIAVIDAGQSASLAIHRKFGFQQVAHLREAGEKFDKWLDVIYLQRMLTDEGK